MAQFPTFDRTEIFVNIAALGLSAEVEAEYRQVAELVFKGKTNVMRASKPKPGKNADGDKKALVGKAAYVWRWIGFHCVRNHQLQCIPCTDTFDLPAYDEDGQWRSRLARDMAKDLDRLVDAFMKTISLRDQPGTIRWGRALGMIG